MHVLSVHCHCLERYRGYPYGEFVLENVGPIETGTLPSGDMKVWHPLNEKLRDIVEGSCRGRGYWNAEYNNWIVKAPFADTVLSEIASQTTRIA